MKHVYEYAADKARHARNRLAEARLAFEENPAGRAREAMLEIDAAVRRIDILRAIAAREVRAIEERQE